MATVPFQLQYELSRRERLIPHVRIWGPFAFVIPLALLGFLYFSISVDWRFVLPILPCIWLFGNLFVGLADPIFQRTVQMDLQVEENAVGLLIGKERSWLFLDGFLSIEQLTKGVWTGTSIFCQPKTQGFSVGGAGTLAAGWQGGGPKPQRDFPPRTLPNDVIK